ncbi:hypothetical protein D3C87_1878150 [compost metagenome]
MQRIADQHDTAVPVARHGLDHLLRAAHEIDVDIADTGGILGATDKHERLAALAQGPDAPVIGLHLKQCNAIELTRAK